MILIVHNYLDQSTVLRLFYKDYTGEPLLNPTITYDKRKDYYPFEIIDLRFQIDRISPKKLRLFDEYNDNPANTFL